MEQKDIRETVEKLWEETRDTPDAYITIDDIYKRLYGDSQKNEEGLKRSISSQLHDFKNFGIILKRKYINGKQGFRLSDEHTAQNNPFKIYKDDYSNRRRDFMTELRKDMPYEWMSNGAKRKADPKRKVLMSDRIMNLNQIGILPDLLYAIQNRIPIRLSYNSKYIDEVEVHLHPAFLKEFSGRWYVCGINTDAEGNTVNKQGERTDGDDKYQVYAIDRIVTLDMIQDGRLEYIPSEDGYWMAYFAPLYGIWHNHTEPQEIVIETQNRTTYYRLRTKPIHHNQEEIQPMDEKEKARFRIRVIPNRELTSLLMSYREKIKVIGPEKYREEFIGSLLQTLKLYN